MGNVCCSLEKVEGSEDDSECDTDDNQKDKEANTVVDSPRKVTVSVDLPVPPPETSSFECTCFAPCNEENYRRRIKYNNGIKKAKYKNNITTFLNECVADTSNKEKRPSDEEIQIESDPGMRKKVEFEERYRERLFNDKKKQIKEASSKVMESIIFKNCPSPFTHHFYDRSCSNDIAKTFDVESNVTMPSQGRTKIDLLEISNGVCKNKIGPEKGSEIPESKIEQPPSPIQMINDKRNKRLDLAYRDIDKRLNNVNELHVMKQITAIQEQTFNLRNSKNGIIPLHDDHKYRSQFGAKDLSLDVPQKGHKLENKKSRRIKRRSQKYQTVALTSSGPDSPKQDKHFSSQSSNNIPDCSGDLANDSDLIEDETVLESNEDSDQPTFEGEVSRESRKVPSLPCFKSATTFFESPDMFYTVADQDFSMKESTLSDGSKQNGKLNNAQISYNTDNYETSRRRDLLDTKGMD